VFDLHTSVDPVFAGKQLGRETRAECTHKITKIVLGFFQQYKSHTLRQNKENGCKRKFINAACNTFVDVIPTRFSVTSKAAPCIAVISYDVL